MLVTGIAFGLIGLDLRQVVEDAGDELPGDARARRGRRRRRVRGARALDDSGLAAARAAADLSAAPRTGREAVLLTWCGMRGLATLALALSLPLTTADGAPFPARAELTSSRCRCWS